MRNLHHLLAVLSILLMGWSTITMIHGKTMEELIVSLIGMVEGFIIFLMYERIDYKLKNK